MYGLSTIIWRFDHGSLLQNKCPSDSTAHPTQGFGALDKQQHSTLCRETTTARLHLLKQKEGISGALLILLRDQKTENTQGRYGPRAFGLYLRLFVVILTTSQLAHANKHRGYYSSE